MTKSLLSNQDRTLITQALIDGSGYPKSDEDQNRIKFSPPELHKLTNQLLEDDSKELSSQEKQMVVNCLDGALHYVDIDIPSLYDVSEAELKIFKETLERRWNMRSTFGE